jgi:hypothetical protein
MEEEEDRLVSMMARILLRDAALAGEEDRTEKKMKYPLLLTSTVTSR